MTQLVLEQAQRPIELTNRDKIRYDRQMRITGFGIEGQRKLKNARVLVAGAGGLGCPIAIYLAVAGIGHIRIVDKETIELSNLNRQILHWDKDVNRLKTGSAEEKLRAINPDINVEALKTEITESTVPSLAKDADIIVDGMDNFLTRFILNKAAVELGVPFIHGSIYGLEGRATTVIPRKTPCLQCIFPEAPPREVFPVIGVTPALIAVVEATEVIKCITGIGRLLENRLLLYDGESLTFREIPVFKDPRCPTCGTSQRGEKTT